MNVDSQGQVTAPPGSPLGTGHGGPVTVAVPVVVYADAGSNMAAQNPAKRGAFLPRPSPSCQGCVNEHMNSVQKGKF